MLHDLCTETYFYCLFLWNCKKWVSPVFMTHKCETISILYYFWPAVIVRWYLAEANISKLHLATSNVSSLIWNKQEAVSKKMIFAFRGYGRFKATST